jgi:4'-phosphopantetheinyl transferase
MDQMNIRSAGISFSPRPIPSFSEVHLWRIDLEAVALGEDRWESLLSADERNRANRFRFAVDRQRFSATRALLRMILGSYLECDPQNLTFAYSEQQKPTLAPPHAESGLRFNVSHSGGVSLIAFTQGREVGVDVEQIRQEFDPGSLAARFFSSSEQKELASYTADQLQEAFFRCWTRKEAYIKAHGSGLSLPLQHFDVSLAPRDLTCLRATRPDASEASRWSLRDVPAGEGYAAALCVEGQSWTLKDWCCDSQQ